MEHSILLSFEVVLFFLSLGYLIYYLGEKLIMKKWFSFDRFKTRRNIRVEKTLEKTIKKKSSKKSQKSAIAKDTSKISEKQKLRLIEIQKRVQINSAKWYFDTAKNLIVEWLAIDNINKDLNLELANIYEKEKNYKNAQYIYEDLISRLEDNYEVIKKLAYSLALQWKFKKSIKQYEIAFKKRKADMEVIDALANLYFESGDHDKCLKFTKIYIMEKPRNVDKLMMKWLCLEKLGQNSDAVESYKKILQLQPYNSDVIKRVKELSGE